MFKIVFWFLVLAAIAAGGTCAVFIIEYAMIDTVRPQVDQFANAHTWLVWAALISLFAYGFSIESTRCRDT